MPEVTLLCFFSDSVYAQDRVQLQKLSADLDSIGCAVWYAVALLYFAVYGRKTLVYSPEEDFAAKQRAAHGLD